MHTYHTAWLLALVHCVVCIYRKKRNEDNTKHLIIELGDVMWYVAQATMALDISFDEVIQRNVKKLEKRYPGGSFEINRSEVRSANDR